MSQSFISQSLSGLFSKAAIPGYQGRVSDSDRLYQPELLGLRAVAILIIVCGHLLQRVERFDEQLTATPLGKLAVEIFATPFTGCRILFFISGFTLLIYQFKRQSVDRVFLGNNIFKTIIRLWPPYFLILTATFTFLTLTGYKPIGTYQFESEPESLTKSFLASALFCHVQFFDTFPRLFPPGWFLEVHVQFVVVGTALWALYLKIPQRRRLLLGLLGLTVFSAISIVATLFESRGAQYSLLTCMPYFWAGALAADFRLQAIDGATMNASRFGNLLGWGGVAIMVLTGGASGNLVLLQIIHIVCLVLIAQASFVRDSVFHRVMVSRLLARIGIASYSIYLVHLQVLQLAIPRIVHQIEGLPVAVVVLVCFALGLCLVLFVSLPFYWLVERPSLVIAERTAARIAKI